MDVSTMRRLESSVSLKRLKRFIEKTLPRESLLCKLILSEKDELTAESFLSKGGKRLRGRPCPEQACFKQL
jgi:hypothetical protein